MKYEWIVEIDDDESFHLEEAKWKEELVRCKDCRWGREVCGNIECSADLNLPPEYHGYEWYCPNGERRENETN